MTWAKQIDRTKFPRAGMVTCSWDKDTRSWVCAMWAEIDIDDDPIAIANGADPVEAMLAMCISLGALAEAGEWIAPPAQS